VGVAIPGLFPFPTREVFIEETTGLYRVWFLAEEKVEEITEEKSEAPVQEQGSESGDEELLKGVARAAVKYISKEYNVPEEIVEEVVKDVLREPDIAEELMGTARKIRGIVDMLRAGKISDQIADAEMAKIIKAVGDKIVEKIVGEGRTPYALYPPHLYRYPPPPPYPYPYWYPAYPEDTELKSLLRTALKYALMIRVLDSVGGRREDNSLLSTIVSAMSNTTSSIVSALTGKGEEIGRDRRYEELRKEIESLKQLLEKKEREKEIESLRKDILQHLNQLKYELEKKLDEQVGVVRQRVEALERSYNDIVDRMRDAIDGIKRAIDEGNINKVKEEVKKAEDMFSELRRMSETIDELKKILESLGYKVVHPGSTELEKEKVDKMYTIFDKYIGPALKELITEPEKIVKAIKELRSLAQESAGGGGPTTIDVEEEMPSIE